MNNFPPSDPIFSARTAQLEDARAEGLATVERQLVTEAAAAEMRLTDFLAAGVAALERRGRAPPLDTKNQVTVEYARDTPERYGEAMAPYFLDILKEVARGTNLPPEFIPLR